MPPFSPFPKEDARVEKSDGSTVGPYKSTFAGNTIVIWDEKADGEEGDTILRSLPSGKDERSIVTEAKFFQRMHSIHAHYQIKFTKDGGAKMPQKLSHNITINGAQPVQIGDYNTQNIINSFQALKNQIESSTASHEEKEEAKSILSKLINHPLATSILGAAAGAVLG
ncbi:hypothetical protein [Dickeya solani]|uniref:Uncharacterized protein n=1 Tax=Dickeya solani TaxID=1089444 RepID=A0ABU4EB08_9GAMM|nr:hypothetical protein [Dickeya solani]MCA6998749.1 hypothetical protein [Dickeya solani]MCZ0822200.1 hypothetical protein [Dickeya solani]MDV6994701.1 hypothetical protein [Dickeya solani]MDV7004080.1 hypothetical protein [Dickeya solani]MDV7039749.1 hypothetical protein [Dickeya solani]